MLSTKQIKLLAKPYQDKTIANKNQGCVKVGLDSQSWSNGYILFYEPLPLKAMPKKHTIREINSDKAGKLQAASEKTSIQVWPTMIVPLGYSNKKRAVQFVNADGVEVWADGRYVSATLLKRRTGGKEVSWWYNPEHRMLSVRNGRVIALLMPIDSGEILDRPDWWFRNTELPN